jgi:outer membrane protein assembly factor BamE
MVSQMNIFSRHPLIISLTLSALLSTLAGCQLAYKQDIPQGNIIADENIAKLKAGLTEEQVRYLFGNPVLNDPLHANRWDYLYYLKPGYGKTERKHLVIFFEEGKVTHYHFEPLVKY